MYFAQGGPWRVVTHAAFGCFDKLPRHHTAGMNQIKEHIQSLSSSIAQATELLELFQSHFEEREYEMHFGTSRVIISTQDPVLLGQEFELNEELYSVSRIIRRVEPEGGPEAASVVILIPVAVRSEPTPVGGESMLL